MHHDPKDVREAFYFGVVVGIGIGGFAIMIGLALGGSIL